MNSGARIDSTCVVGDASTRKSRSCSSEPYSRSRTARRYADVFSRNVTKLEMPTDSIPAAHSSGWNASPASTMKPPYERPYSTARDASISGRAASHACNDARSRTESSRSRTSSRCSKRFPYPLEPRTFGAATAYPRETRYCVSGA